MAMPRFRFGNARIGEAEDMMRRGIVSRAMRSPAACAWRPVNLRRSREAAQAAPWPHRAPPAEPRSLGIRWPSRTTKDHLHRFSTLILPEERDRCRHRHHGAEASGQVVAPVSLPWCSTTTQASAPIGQVQPACSILTMPGFAGANGGGVVGKDRDGRSTLPRASVRRERSRYRLGGRVGGSALALARLVAEKSRLSNAGRKPG